MKRVIGLGGIFFKSENPKLLCEWYKKHLGIATEDWGAIFSFKEACELSPNGYTVWSPFSETSDHFSPSTKSFMFNFIVDDLEVLLNVLRGEGVTVFEKIEETEFGKFGWIMDPEGNKLELLELPKT